MRSRFVPLALLAGLAVCLFVSRLPAPPLPAGTTTGLTALDKYLINDVTFVGLANVKTALASPMHKKLKKEVAAVADHELFNKYLKQFGVKPLEDIERIVLVMGEGKVRERNFNVKDEPENDERMYFLFQGKFDPKKFEAGFAQIVKDHAGPRVKLHGKGSSAILEANYGTFFALVDRSAFVIAPSKKIVEEVQGRASGKIKAQYKLDKHFPAALKSLKADTAIDAVGFGAMALDRKYESMGKDGYRLTPITLDQLGMSKFTVRVEVKDDLKGKVTFEAGGKGNFAETAKKIAAGLEEMQKRAERPGRDGFDQAMMKAFKNVTAKIGDKALTFEGKLGHDDAKALLDAMKQEMDRDARRSEVPPKK